ncbi:gamma-glutamylcyclotransferase [Streptomyces sp. NBC_00237]|uniref:gamma-glutamylcyclotransferase family protein n=1 Tax=Streptomyces sp. NBC_00237 TaxID=2975687 RepID=UPI00224F5E36|nr:gamma-glutamylcyclotransferase family protein [Streptomyces sp. NBC_00237]MCX5204976.1 gamma-glutamylcyclotransferase [Streptomyces sp. NBC_00237]
MTERPVLPDVLFVYGTLQFPEVLGVLLGRVPAGVATSAPGWRAAALEGRPYPGLVAASGGVARGVLLGDLTVREWRVLDEYEGDEYELRRIALEGGVRGWTYVWVGAGTGTGTGVRQDTWDAEAFRIQGLHGFLAGF